MGPALTSIRVGDTPEAWVAAGFTVDDGTVRVGPIRIELDTDDDLGPARVGWSLAGEVAESIDGIPTAAAEATHTDAPPPAHANGITGVDHVVVMTPDLERTVSALTAAGFEERRRRAVPGAEPARTQVFFWAGEIIVELIGTDEPSGDDPASIWGLALVADDLDACAGHLGELASTPRPAVQPGRRILALRHRELGLSLPVAVMTPHLR